MRFAYADPPYLGCCKLYGHQHPDGLCWDDPATHLALFARLRSEFPDGWALSCSTPSLTTLLPMAGGARVCAWVKPFASFKPNVNPGYAWEPVLVAGGRKRSRAEATVRDWLSEPITLRKGLTGAKPPAVCQWVLDLLGWTPADDLVDLFPGTGIMGEVVNARRGQPQPLSLFDLRGRAGGERE